MCDPCRAGGHILDQPNGYGPVNVRSMEKAVARYNADSYAYFMSVSPSACCVVCPHAMTEMQDQELFWSYKCGKNGIWKTYLDPRAGIDDEDPLCGGTCQTF